jgi:hypothetical protein
VKVDSETDVEGHCKSIKGNLQAMLGGWVTAPQGQGDSPTDQPGTGHENPTPRAEASANKQKAKKSAIEAKKQKMLSKIQKKKVAYLIKNVRTPPIPYKFFPNSLMALLKI